MIGFWWGFLIGCVIGVLISAAEFLYYTKWWWTKEIDDGNEN